MPLTIGSRLGSYEVLSALGSGGMGEVYKARDTKLHRDVALKILPREFAHDRERLARFSREAQALASLNHPNIGAIYGLEESEGIGALVLEFVTGQTVLDILRRQRSGLPVPEALALARQIAEALEAAHDKSIVHRDLKPANVMVTPEGTVKVLDFGIAKVGDTAAHAPDDLTATTEHTQTGQVLGTAGYMSPEQARGASTDKRTDIWAFGCVLFECLTGRPVFTGPTTTDVIASILQREPDWRALPASTPAHIRRLLQRCLEKDPRQRLRDIGDAYIELSAGTSDAATPAAAGPTRWTAAGIAGVTVALAAVIAASMAGGYALRGPSSAPAAAGVSTFPLHPPSGGIFARNVPFTFLAISPDGSQVAFLGSVKGSIQIYLRSMSSLEARPLAGTEGARSPFWSPDGRFLAFFAGSQLKRVDVNGGAPVPICEVTDTDRRHGSWGTGGTIVFGLTDGSAISRVASAGGAVQKVMEPDRAKGETRTSWPWFLPDGKRFVYLVRTKDGGELRLWSEGKPPRRILSAVSNVQWVDPDILVYGHDGVLVGQRFDLENERIVGDPFSVAEPIDYHYTVAKYNFSTSRNGVLVYHPHVERARLEWRDRNGNAAGTVAREGGYLSVRMSPDGTKALYERAAPKDGAWDLWTIDLGRGAETRLTADRGSEGTPVWTADGNSVVFSSDRGGTSPHLYRKNLQTGVEEQLRPPGRQQQAMDISTKSDDLFFIERSANGIFDIFTLPLANPTAARPLITSRFGKFGVRVSPDGLAIAFVSGDSGAFEVYVALVSAPAAVVPVSVGGGRLPHWSRDGHELFYLSADRRLMTVPVKTTPRLQPGTPTPLFMLPASDDWIDFDVTPDGRKFLGIVPVVDPNREPSTVVINWPSAVRR